MHNQQIDQCIEALCKKGCRSVWGDIDALESGEVLPEAADLSAADIQIVLTELKAIMSVYEGTCSAN